MVTVYSTRRTFMVKKDVLPTNSLRKVIYSFECQQCDSRYMGRTLQHLSARIRQHVPLHLLPPEARRGRPPKVRDTGMDTGEVATGQQPTETRHWKRSVRLAALRELAVSNGCGTISNTDDNTIR